MFDPLSVLGSSTRNLLIDYPWDSVQEEEADYFQMTFKEPGGDIFYPESIWISNRNSMLRLALGWEYGQGENWPLICK